MKMFKVKVIQPDGSEHIKMQHAQTAIQAGRLVKNWYYPDATKITAREVKQKE